MSEEVIEPKAFLYRYEAMRHEADPADAAIVLDVREEWEWDYYHLEGSVLIPMQKIPASLGRIPMDRTVYVVCAHGIRSAAVCDYLERNGYDKAVNVLGGMAAVAALRGFQYD